MAGLAANGLDKLKLTGIVNAENKAHLTGSQFTLNVMAPAIQLKFLAAAGSIDHNHEIWRNKNYGFIF